MQNGYFSVADDLLLLLFLLHYFLHDFPRSLLLFIVSAAPIYMLMRDVPMFHISINKTKWFSDQCFSVYENMIEEYIAMKTLNKNCGVGRGQERRGNNIKPFFLMMIDGLCTKKRKKILSQK